jgi:hypothetical protein
VRGRLGFKHLAFIEAYRRLYEVRVWVGFG